MSQRQTALCADFRTRIATAYYGCAHVSLIYAIGIAAIWYCARQVSHPAWYEYLVIPGELAVDSTPPIGIGFLVAVGIDTWIRVADLWVSHDSPHCGKVAVLGLDPRKQFPA